MFGNYLQVRGAQARAVETDEEQSELVLHDAEAPTNSSGRKLVLGVLGLGAVVAVGVTATSSSSPKMNVVSAATGEVSADGRFLQSEDLLNTIATHAVRFQQEIGGEVAEGDHEELKGHARRSIAEMAAKVSTADVESGRVLKDLQLSDEQWFQSKQILEALHDKKVQDIGNFVQGAVRNSATLDEASAKVAEREDEFRALRDRFVPPTAQDVVNSPAGSNHWSMSMHQGALEMSGDANGWSGSLAVGGEETARRLAENVTADRRLMTKQQMIYLLVTAIVVGVLGIVLTILTAALGAHAATVLFLVGAGLDGLLCTGSIGLTFIPGFKNFNTWIPCVILSSFTGLEAIWTFRKPRCSHSCPKGGKIQGKSCFFVEIGTYNKAAAATVCAGKGGRLASINEQKDLTTVGTLLAAKTVDGWTGATRSCPLWPASGPAPTPTSCGNPWSWTDGSTWFQPGASTTSMTKKLVVAGGPKGYMSIYLKSAAPTVYEGALDTTTRSAICEIWMC
jgi:hypothetical protein